MAKFTVKDFESMTNKNIRTFLSSSQYETKVQCLPGNVQLHFITKSTYIDANDLSRIARLLEQIVLARFMSNVGDDKARDEHKTDMQLSDTDTTEDYMDTIVKKDDKIMFGAKVTFTLDFLVRKGHTHMKPEDLFNEWFNKSSLTLITAGHAFRDGSILGNSEKVVDVKIYKK